MYTDVGTIRGPDYTLQEHVTLLVAAEINLTYCITLPVLYKYQVFDTLCFIFKAKCPNPERGAVAAAAARRFVRVIESLPALVVSGANIYCRHRPTVCEAPVPRHQPSHTMHPFFPFPTRLSRRQHYTIMNHIEYVGPSRYYRYVHGTSVLL